MNPSPNDKSYAHIVYEPALKLQDLRTPELKEEAGTLALPYGILEQKQWLFDGICIRHTRNTYNDNFSLKKENDLNVVHLEFNLKGNYIIRHVGNIYKVQSGQHNIVYSPSVSNTFENADLNTETFVIQFLPELFLSMVQDSNDTLKRFADKILEGKPVVIAQHSLFINTDLQRVINEIIHCRYTGSLKKLFLLSKSIELLVIQAEAYDKANQTGDKSVRRKGDQDRIVYAREYLIENFKTPPTLTELSKIVGVNEYKLKRGFKEVFQTTVFGYLTDYRLGIAKKILQEEHKTVSEIAYELGYSSPQHFSTAFKKKFGIPPKGAK